MSRKQTHKHAQVPRSGVLVTNLGTPDAPTASALRRYLGEFLWDPRVVRIPRPVWWLLLHGLVLRTRPPKSAHNYQTIWTPEGSPLLVNSQRLTDRIKQQLTALCPGPVEVVLGMRYGNPSISAGLETLRAAGCERVLVLPLYPQYSSATTASTVDAVAAVMKTWMWVPELRFIMQYHDEPGYIAALTQQIKSFREQNGSSDLLVFSFHGMPKATLLDGDPYFCQCQKTARLVAQRLKLADDQWRVVFQSRFGKAEWLQPYADRTLQKLPGEGKRNIDVVCPGFAADCLETLEEMAMQNRDLFLKAGGQQYRYIPALNDGAGHADFLAGLARRHMAGWPEVETAWSDESAEAEASARQARAMLLGAKG